MTRFGLFIILAGLSILLLIDWLAIGVRHP
jgi:hypothetical protein